MWEEGSGRNCPVGIFLLGIIARDGNNGKLRNAIAGLLQATQVPLLTAGGILYFLNFTVSLFCKFTSLDKKKVMSP